MNRFKLLFLTTTFIFSSFIFPAEGGGGGSKEAYSLRKRGRANSFRKAPKSTVSYGPAKMSGTIRIMKLLGYRPNKKGVCYGITGMAVQAALRGDVEKFLTRLLKIRNGQYDELVEKKNKGSQLSQEEEGELSDLLAFLDGVQIFQEGPLSAMGGYSFQNWRKVMRFFQKAKTPEDRTPEFYTKAGVGLYTDEDLIQLIEFVIKEENSVGIFIMNSVHITALVRVGQGKALYVDHDRLQILEADRYGAALIKERMGTSVLSMEQVSSIDLDLLTTTEPLEQLYSKVREQLKESELLLAFQHLCFVGDLDGVRHLVQKKGVDAKDSRFNNTYTLPLMMSIICNNMELVKYLVEECSVDMDIKTKSGCTAAMIAVCVGNLDALKYLKEKGADLTLFDNDNKTPLIYGLLHDALHVVSYLLELPEIEKTITLQEAFKIALDYGAEKVVRYLEPLVDVTKEPLEQSFTRAILKKDLELVTSLVEEKEVEPSKVLEGQNSLVYASKYSTSDILEFLLKKIKDINLEDTDGASPLKRILSEKKINWKAVKLFLEHGADYETKNSDGEPLLVLSARDGALEILTQLKTRADIDLKKHTSKKYGENILFVAIRNGNLEYVKYLLENLADVFSNINPLDEKLALLENFKRSCAEGNLLDVRDFIEKKVVDPKDPQFLENNGLTPLMISIKNNHMELVKYLVEKCFVDVNIKDKKYGYTPAISAIFESNLEALKYLKEKGADLTLCDNSKLTPVCYALLFRALDIFSYLLELPEIKETISLEGAFKIALDYGGEEVVRYLESRMNLTEEPLEQFRRAILKKDLELVTSLLEEKEVDSSDLIYAAKYSNLDILEVLLKKSKNVDLEDSDGATPLKRILSEKKINWKAVKLFLEHGADYETKNSAGESLLVLSARDGALEILTQLKTRADIDFKKHTSKDGENILFVAIRNGNLEYVKYLLEENLFSQDDKAIAKKTWAHKVLVQNSDLLSYAFYFGSFNIVRYLFDFQQKKNIGTIDLYDNMMRGIERGSYGIFSYMISKGASFFDSSLSVEGVSFTPLSFSKSSYVKKNSLIIQTLEKIEEQFSLAKEGKMPTEIIFPEVTDSFGKTYLDYYRAPVQTQELPAPPAKANCCEIL